MFAFNESGLLQVIATSSGQQCHLACCGQGLGSSPGPEPSCLLCGPQNRGHTAVCSGAAGGWGQSLWGHLSCWGPFSILWVKATLSGFPWRFSGCLPRGPALVSGIGGDCKPSSPCPGKRAVGFSWGWPSSVASLSPPRRYSPELLGAGRSVSGGRLALAAHAQTQGTARGAGGFELGGGHSVVVVSDQNLLGSFSSACVLTHIYFWSKCLRARCRENT